MSLLSFNGIPKIIIIIIIIIIIKKEIRLFKETPPSRDLANASINEQVSGLALKHRNNVVKRNNQKLVAMETSTEGWLSIDTRVKMLPEE